MAEYHLGNGTFQLTYIPGTNYIPVCGGDRSAVDEVYAQARVRFGGTLQNLFIRVRTNTLNAASTLRSRVNGANGNQSVSIGASATGDFEDTVNSDSLTTADLINTEYSTGAMSGSMWARVIAYTLDNTDDDRGILLTEAPNTLIGPSRTRFCQIFGEFGNNGTIETDLDYIYRHSVTFSALRAYLSDNALEGASTVTLRVNGADGNLTLSIPAGTTGEFEDTVNTDAISSGDRVNHKIVTGANTHGQSTFIIQLIQMHHDAPETRVSACGEESRTRSYTGLSFLPIEGTIGWQSLGTSLDHGFPARFPLEISNYYLNMKANTYDVATVFTVREGVADVDTALAITVPAATTGRFEDTVDTVFVAVGDRMSTEWDSTGRTAGTADVTAIGMEVTLPPPEVWVSIGVTLELPSLAARRGIIGSGLISRRSAPW